VRVSVCIGEKQIQVIINGEWVRIRKEIFAYVKVLALNWKEEGNPRKI
jgi:hypothetical protein